MLSSWGAPAPCRGPVLISGALTNPPTPHSHHLLGQQEPGCGSSAPGLCMCQKGAGRNGLQEPQESPLVASKNSMQGSCSHGPPCCALRTTGAPPLRWEHPSRKQRSQCQDEARVQLNGEISALKGLRGSMLAGSAGGSFNICLGSTINVI